MLDCQGGGGGEGPTQLAVLETDSAQLPTSHPAHLQCSSLLPLLLPGASRATLSAWSEALSVFQKFVGISHLLKTHTPAPPPLCCGVYFPWDSLALFLWAPGEGKHLCSVHPIELEMEGVILTSHLNKHRLGISLEMSMLVRRKSSTVL